MSDHKIILRNFEGYITTYEEPIEYRPHDPQTCSHCQNKRMEPGQTGLTGLLDGEEMFIKPQGFDELHNRGGGAHRLRASTDKWKPLGIGSGEES
jgi:lysine 2,3-aminomutase